MARKKTAKKKAASSVPSPEQSRQSPPAEDRYQQELKFPADEAPRPAGWKLSPQAIVTFICGSRGDKLKLPKGAKV